MSLVHDIPTLAPGESASEQRFSGRRAILVVILLCLFLAVIRILFIDGWHRTLSIDGPSMAPTWMNEHYNVTCADCGNVWSCDATVGIPSAGWWCPNCGTLQTNPLREEFPTAHVLVDRWPLLWSEPSRFEVVALQAPGEVASQRQPTIKRIIGLPGEEVSIRAGDVFINGVRATRRINQWRQTALVVHNDSQRRIGNNGEEHPRWKPKDSDSGWQVTDDGYRFDVPENSAGPSQQSALQPLLYHHQRLRRGTHIETTPPLDDDSYNQDPRELELVPDLAISLWAHVATGANLELSLHDGTAWCRASWSAEKHEWTLFYGKVKLTSSAYSWHTRIPVHTEWIRCDGELVLVINGRTIARNSIDGVEASNDDQELPATDGLCAAISASAGSIELTNIQILRDIHYLAPHPTTGGPATAAWQLGVDEYFVLGDNPPVSIDSRHWSAGSIQRDNIWGVIRRP